MTGLRQVSGIGTESTEPKPVYATELEAFDDYLRGRITRTQYEREAARIRAE